MQLNELALHKSNTNTIDEFEQQINNFKNSNLLELKQLISKLYFQVPNTNIGIPASTFQHDNKKHVITKNDWKRLIKFIGNPQTYVEAKYSKAFRGPNYLYKYFFDNKYYGVAACKTKHGWLITTFFQDKEPNIDNWLLGNGKAQPKVPTAAYVPGCSLSEGLNNIITHNNKNVNTFNEKFEELEHGIYAANITQEIINWFKNKPKSYRVAYDKDINMYFIGDAYNFIHQDLIEAAINAVFYPNMFGGEAQDYLQDALFDGNLLLFAFYPDESKAQDLEKSSDGYTRKYVYDFGIIYTHEMSKLEDFPIYKVLGNPIKKEDIFEDIDIAKLNEEFRTFFS